MGRLVSDPAPVPADQGPALLALYDEALPQVYGYLVRRCGDDRVAEDLTSETFMAAVDAVRRNRVADLTIAWLIGIARHKLVDHWRAAARDERRLRAVEADPGQATDVDDWDAQVDAVVAHEVLGALGAHHRSALTLRYLDGLPVRAVADHLGRTEHATEALLVRARHAFRVEYGERNDDA
jgi:RNA polymerase sigma-70 factor (ECF subfamily)